MGTETELYSARQGNKNAIIIVLILLLELADVGLQMLDIRLSIVQTLEAKQCPTKQP